jgi:hypothetical protein
MSMRYKLVFTVPLADAERVREAVGEAGAGKSDKYAFASFSVRGTGRFKPLPGAEPAIGEVGKMEEVEEERVETVVEEGAVDAVLAALRAAHPYEEIAYDLIRLEDQ